MDLTKEYPRSPHERLAGVVMLARTTDKAKAKLADKLGEYNYDCPLDNQLFDFLGANGEQFLERDRTASGDADIETYARALLGGKSQAEIDEFNSAFVKRAPKPGSEGEEYFLEIRNAAAPDRTDVTTWADVLDLDEKRQVPRRDSVPA